MLDKQRSYQQQYGDMYFLRLTKIKPAIDKVAAEAWTGTTIGEEEAQRVERVLDVRQGELCWVTGTVYMEMPLKPNILEDVSKDVCHISCRSTMKWNANVPVALDLRSYSDTEIFLPRRPGHVGG